MTKYDGNFMSGKFTGNLKSFLQILVSTCALLGWWGFFYPELTLTPDTVNVISAESECGNTSGTCAPTDTTAEIPDYSTWDFDSSLYRELLFADRSRIVFRSRLLTNFSLFWEALQNGDK